MKLATFTHAGKTTTGVQTTRGMVDLHATDAAIPTTMLALLQGGDAMLARAQAAADSGAAIPMSSVTLECPIPDPPRILAVALNYMDHFYEIPDEVVKAHNVTPPEIPVIFNKQTTSANGPYSDIDLPEESSQLDYEAELGVIIGKTCRRVSVEQALEVVAGYTVLNDVTIRDWQLATATMTMGKSWDTHCPMGPVIVTTDEITDPHNLRVIATVDGDVRQDFNTRDMIFDIAQQIAHLSTAFTLLPGDVIATGTSAGVALWAEGQPFLKEGELVRVDIEGIGYIENRVAREKTPVFIR